MTLAERKARGGRVARIAGALLLGAVLAGAPVALAAPLLTAATPPAAAPPTAEALRVITLSARRIASYHEAVARTRERVRRDDPDLADAVRFLVVTRGSAWHVLVLQKNTATPEARGRLVLADAGFLPTAGEVTTYQRFQPAKPVPVDGVIMLLALDVARAAASASAQEAKPPFEESIFRSAERGGPITVYLQTKPAVPGTTRFGSDIRVDISADGTQVKLIEALHTAKESTAVPVPKQGGGEPALHAHEEGDLPTETDVAVVLDQPTLAPVLVLTPRFMFRIGEDGATTYLGPNPVPPVDAGGGQ